MTINLPGKRHEVIHVSDLRTGIFYADWLQINNHINTSNVPRQDVDNCRQALNHLIKQSHPIQLTQSKLLDEMEAARDVNILPTEAFEWLSKDERAAFWVWAYICRAADSQTGITLPANAVSGQNWYHRLQLSTSPASHQERISIIFNFFDRIIIPTAPANHLKKQVMEKLKDQWKNIYSKPRPLKWLPDEEEAVLWAWNSLHKFQQEQPFDTPIPIPINSSFQRLTTWFTPLSHSERLLAVRATIDLWDGTSDSNRLLLLNLNKAWNQRKLRQSRTDKKALNTYLKNKTKERLDALATEYDMRISDVLEKLINEHYRQTLPPKE